MKRYLLMFVMFAFVIVLAACGSSDDKSKDSNDKATAKSGGDFEWPKSFVVVTPATGSSSHTQALAWTNKLAEDTGMNMRVMPENSGPVKLKGIEEEKFDAHFAQLGEILFSVEAKYGYDDKDAGPLPLATIWTDSAQPSAIMVRGDSDIKEVSDIKKGTKIAYWAIPGGKPPVEALLAWADVSIDDVVLVETSDFADQIKMVADGRADIATMATPTSPAVTEASAAPHGIRFIDLDPEKDPEGAKRFNEVMPAHYFSKISEGPEEFIGTYGWGTSGNYFTLQDHDPDVIYNMVKWIAESYDDIKGLHPEFDPNIGIEANRELMDITYMPLHEGTIRYMKEIDQWHEEDDLRQEYNTKLVDKYIAAYAAAEKEAESAGIKVDAANKEWTEFWTEYKEKEELPVLAIMTDEEIAEKLEAGF